jgi:hypothetical protein
MLFVRMLTIILHRMSRSIQTKEACPPVIIAASAVTSDPNVHSSRSWRFRGSCQQELHQALYLLRHFRLHRISRQFVPAYQSGKLKKNKPRRYKRKPQKPNGSHGYEGLLSLIQGMLTRKRSPRVKQVWVKKDETIHPMRENERT